MARQAKSYWSSGVITRLAKSPLIRCGGLIPYWCKDPTGGRKPINAKCETVGTLPTFRDAYRLRRCILPVDGFYEWKAIKGQRAKQPYAIAMKDGTPFGIAGLWESWKDPASGEWIRTFAVITTDANELVAEIHDRMPAISNPRPRSSKTTRFGARARESV
jgi:putative SOS response-associated peptidase YedK